MKFSKRLSLIESKAVELESLPIDQLLLSLNKNGDSFKLIDSNKDIIDYYCASLDANYIISKDKNSKIKCKVYIGSFSLKR